MWTFKARSKALPICRLEGEVCQLVTDCLKVGTDAGEDAETDES